MSLVKSCVQKIEWKLQGSPSEAREESRCVITFGHGDQGEKLSFSPKVTRFFFPKIFLQLMGVPQVVPHKCQEAFIVFLEFTPKISQKPSFSLNFGKIFCQNYFEDPNEHSFSLAASCRLWKDVYKKQVQNSKAASRRHMRKAKIDVL